MALSRNDLIALTKIAANAKASSPVAYSFGEEKYSVAEVNEVIRKEIAELACDYSAYRANKNLIFELIEKTLDEVLPIKVREQFGAFAETMQISQGDQYIFIQKVTEASKRRAKKFVTRVGLAGVYEVFKLDGTQIGIKTGAIGGACYIPFEEMLDGRVAWSDLVQVVADGMTDYIYVEIEAALKSLATSSLIPNKNKVSGAWSETNFDKLLTIADSYAVGGKSTIYCTFEFAAKMVPTTGVFASNNYSDNMKDELWKKGYFSMYKEHPVVILQNSLEPNGLNDTKVIDPQYCYVIPNGAEKPVKIVIEGETAVREVENEDWSHELQTYKKVGVGLVTINQGFCVYQNTELSQSL